MSLHGLHLLEVRFTASFAPPSRGVNDCANAASSTRDGGPSVRPCQVPRPIREREDDWNGRSRAPQDPRELRSPDDDNVRLEPDHLVGESTVPVGLTFGISVSCPGQRAETIGSQTAVLVAAILADRPHPEQGYRSCLGLLRLSRRDGAARLEAACARALSVGVRLSLTKTTSGPPSLRAILCKGSHAARDLRLSAQSRVDGSRFTVRFTVACGGKRERHGSWRADQRVGRALTRLDGRIDGGGHRLPEAARPGRQLALR